MAEVYRQMLAFLPDIVVLHSLERIRRSITSSSNQFIMTKLLFPSRPRSRSGDSIDKEFSRKRKIEQVINGVCCPKRLNLRRLSVRRLWPLRYLWAGRLPSTLVVFTIAAVIAGKREQREFFGITCSTHPITG